MAVLTYKGGKYRNLAGNQIYDGSKWATMGGDSKIFLDGKWHDFSWEKAALPDVPDEPEIPSWDDFTHLATEEPTTGNVYYMTPAGAGQMDGSSWDNAWSVKQIYSAILTLKQNDCLYMAEGDYGNLDIPIQISYNIVLYGGFVEGDYSWETRDAFKHPTLFRGTGTAPFAVTSGDAAITLDGISIDGFGKSLAHVYGYNMDIRNSSMTSITELNSPSVFTNCRFSGVEGCTVTCASATSCYFRGDENSYITVYVGKLENSTALRCAPITIVVVNILGHTHCGAIFADSINNSVVSDLTLHLTGDLVPTTVTACSSASSSTFVRVNANYQIPFDIAKASGCTVIDSVCKVSPDKDVAPCSFSRSEVYGTIHNSTLFDCSIFEAMNEQLNTCTIVKCSLHNAELVRCTVVNCTGSDVSSIDWSIIVNSDVAWEVGMFLTRSLIVNSVVNGRSNEAVFCTLVNSVTDITDGINNVFWNNNGTCVADGNAQSAYNSANVLTLGTSNDITRFVGTGYAPAIGIQDIGECPNPITDNEGFAAYVASFGDWHPQPDSFLVGKGVYSSSYPTDLDGVARPNPPTLGAYEPRP